MAAGSFRRNNEVNGNVMYDIREGEKLNPMW
jgi:hypothetical protein